MKKITIKLIKCYQFFSKKEVFSGVLPFFFCSSCKFYPSCSDYALEAINKHGLSRGMAKAMYRILKCNPLSEFSVDNP